MRKCVAEINGKMVEALHDSTKYQAGDMYETRSGIVKVITTNLGQRTIQGDPGWLHESRDATPEETEWYRNPDASVEKEMLEKFLDRTEFF